jgi:hypothetical protein
MKRLSIILSLFLIVFTACEKDQDMATVAPADQLVAPILAPHNDAIVVTENNLKENVTFSWQRADFGVPVAVEYSLYVRTGGGNPALLASAHGESIEVTLENLNVAALRVGAQPEAETTVTLYLLAVISSAYPAVQSNEITIRITPLDMMPAPLHLIGNILESDKEWSNANYTYVMFRDDNLSEEETYVSNFRAGGFKFIADKDLGTWDNLYGQVGAGKLATKDADDITDLTTGGYYTIKANISAMTYTITSFDVTGKLTYTAVSFGSTTLAQLAYDPHIWVAEDVTLTDGETRNFVTSGGSFGATGFPYGKAAAGGAAIRVQEGNYFVKFNDLTGHYVFYKTINLGTVTPPALTAPVSHAPIVVSADNRADKLTFSWTAANFNVAADVTYTLYARIGDDGEAKAVDGSSTTAMLVEVTYGALNNAALAAGATSETATDVQFFVEAAISNPPAKRNSDPVTITITPLEFTYPAAVYMTGADFGNWFGSDGTDPGIVEMTPVHSHDGQFWCVRYFTAGNGFKWNTKKGWGGDFSSLGTDFGYTIDGGNAVVATSGFYSVYIDYTTNTITMEEATVYGIDNCFGGWNPGQYPFTVEGMVMKITTTAAGDLRMYAASSATSGVDPWQMEFIILDGKIEYRGTGGDQTRVPVEAGKTVTLDFNAGTGTIN